MLHNLRDATNGVAEPIAPVAVCECDDHVKVSIRLGTPRLIGCTTFDWRTRLYQEIPSDYSLITYDASCPYGLAIPVPITVVMAC